MLVSKFQEAALHRLLWHFLAIHPECFLCRADHIKHNCNQLVKTVTFLYMNARHGLPLKQTDRALLGEQFRDDVETLITDTFTTLKKKKSPQDTEICEVIRFNCSEISELLLEYSHYLTSRKVFCVQCKLCGSFFLAKSKNTQYCEECKVLRKKNSKVIYREK